MFQFQLFPPDTIKLLFRTTFDFIWALKWYILAILGLEIGLLLLERLLKIKIARNIFIIIAIIALAIFIFWVYH